MTKDERQLIRMMNRSFKDKRNSRNIEVKDLSKETSATVPEPQSDKEINEDPIKPYKSNFNFSFNLDEDNPSFDDEADDSNEFESCEFNLESSKKPEMISLTENDIQNMVKECSDRILDEIKNGKLSENSNTLYAIDVDDYLDTDLEIDEDFEDEDNGLDIQKPLVQHFTLNNPWLPYEKDIKLTKFIIYQDNTVDLEFDINFNRPPHLRNEPSDLNDPLKILNQFKALMDKSNAGGNNIECSVTYNNAPDNAIIKSTTIYSIIGKIISMEILQNYGLGLKIKVKGKITNHA